jgi:hypothetical protein
LQAIVKPSSPLTLGTETINCFSIIKVVRKVNQKLCN